MNTAIFGILACLLYSASAGIQIAGLRREIPAKHLLVSVSGIAAILLHGLFTFREIVTDHGINLGILPMASLITLAISSLLMANSLRRPVANLVIAIFSARHYRYPGHLSNHD